MNPNPNPNPRDISDIKTEPKPEPKSMTFIRSKIQPRSDEPKPVQIGLDLISGRITPNPLTSTEQCTAFCVFLYLSEGHRVHRNRQTLPVLNSTLVNS